MTMDEQDPFSERRRAKRVNVPEGTTSVISVENKSPDLIPVKDISLAGILFCWEDQRREDPLGSELNGVYISLPANRLDSESGKFIWIEKAKIVRSFVKESTQNVCLGIEFIDLDNYGVEQISDLVINQKMHMKHL